MKRTPQEIAGDIDRTQMRIDATLDALQQRLRPSNLSRDAARRFAGAGVRKAAALLDHVVDSRGGERARRIIVDAQHAIASLPPGAVAASPIVREAVSAIVRHQARRKNAVKFGAAAIAAALATAAIKGVVAANHDDDEPKPPRRKRSTRKPAAKKKAAKSRKRARRT